MLAYKTVPLEKREHDLRFALGHLGDLTDVGERNGLIDGILLESERDFRRLLDLRILAAEEV